MYVILASQQGRFTPLSGTDVFITNKNEENSTIVKKILDSVAKATMQVKIKISQEKRD